MYLVLMALLALNVSKEVLEAFAIVDHGLVKTTENFAAKNDVYYNDIDQAAAENPVKAGPWKAKADEVKRQAEELIAFIQELKVEIVTAVDGEDAEAFEEHGVNAHLIAAKDDATKADEILIGAAMDGKANDLRSAIEGFREYLLSLVDEEATEVIESIKLNLYTEDPPVSEEHGTQTWQQEHFEHNPMIADITLLSKMQSDVRNAESDAIRYLFSKISEGITFNYLESVVQPESNYIILGQEYNAQIFIAATDTTQEPVVYIGDYDSTITDEGMVDYFMKGELGRDYDSVPVEGGRGIYSLKPSATRTYDYHGLITLKRTDGSKINKPFYGSYRVAQGSVVVSPTKMLFMYQTLENPIEVLAPGTNREDISISVSNGTFTGSSGSYICRPTDLKDCIVSVYDNSGGSRRKIGEELFRVDAPPPPEASLAGKRFGAVTRNELQRELGIEVAAPDWFKFDIEYTITGMTFVNIVGNQAQRMNATNGDFTQEMRDAMNLMPSGNLLQFENIKVVGPDGKEIQLPNLSVTKR